MVTQPVVNYGDRTHFFDLLLDYIGCVDMLGSTAVEVPDIIVRFNFCILQMSILLL